jgi:hypothetical protein
MAGLPPYRDTGKGSDHGSTTSTPLRVKVLFGIVVIALVLLVVVLHLTGSIGPSAH